MKQLLILFGLLVSLSACTSVLVCVNHDDAELNRMTVEELNAMILKNQEDMKAISQAGDSGGADQENCLSQNERIAKIAKSKTKKVPVSRYYTFH